MNIFYAFLFFLSVQLIALIALLTLLILELGFINFFTGAPYLPTKKKNFDQILKVINFKPNTLFLDLGCGDGYIVRKVAKKYQIKAIGIDINPILIFFAKMMARIEKSEKKTVFKIQNILKTDISSADYIYLYLMPKLIEKLKIKLKNEAKPGALIISHAFEIKQWERYHIKTIQTQKTKTFVYQI